MRDDITGADARARIDKALGFINARMRAIGTIGASQKEYEELWLVSELLMDYRGLTIVQWAERQRRGLLWRGRTLLQRLFG